MEVGVISHVFLKGHSIRIEVSSSNFPRFDRNLNTGAEPGIDLLMVSANQTVYHDRQHPSHILLPVIPASEPPAEAGGQDAEPALTGFNQ